MVLIEYFYANTGVADYSLKKLNTPYGLHIVEGIRDLSEKNYQQTYPRIVSYKNHILLGMIKLKGVAEITKFKTLELFLNG